MVNSEEEVEFCEELFDAEISRIVGILRSSMMSTVLEAWLKSKMGESLMFELLWQKSFVNIFIEKCREIQRKVEKCREIWQLAFFLTLTTCSQEGCGDQLNGGLLFCPFYFCWLAAPSRRRTRTKSVL